MKSFLYALIPILLVAADSFSVEPDSLKTYYTGEIIVTSRNEAIVKTSGTIDVEKEKIGSYDNFSLNESLNFLPGLSISQNSRNEALIKLRGFDQRQTAVFFDGVPLYISYDGTYDFSQINSAPVGKITVSKSLTSVLYGANTLAGSVNVITDLPVNKFEASAKLMYGNTYGASARTSGIYKSLYWLISGGFDKSDGFTLPQSFALTRNENGDKRDNSSFTHKSATLKAGFKPLDDFDVSLSFTKSANSKDVPVQIYTAFPRFWKYTEWKNSVLNLISNFKISDILKVRANAYTVNSFNVLNAYDNNTYSSQTKASSFTSTYDDYSKGISLIPEIEINKILSGKFAFLYKRDTHYDQSNRDKPNKKFTAETFTAGFEKNFSVYEFDFIAAVNFDYLNVVFANDSLTRQGILVINGHLGIGKRISDDIYLYANLSNTSRFPTLKELFSEQLGRYVPNPDLDNEKSWNAEAGVKYKNGKVGMINLAAFYSRVNNMITAVYVSSNTSKYLNTGKVTLAGFEFSWLKSFEFLNAEINYTYLNSKNNSDTATDKLEYRPENNVNIILSKVYNFGFSWKLETAFTGKRYCIDGDTRLWRELPDYTVFNARIAQKVLDKFSIFVRVNNIADKYFESEFGFPQAGRNFSLGMELNY